MAASFVTSVRPKSIGMGRNHNVERACTPTEALGRDPKPGLHLSGFLVPGMNRSSRQKGANSRHYRAVPPW